MIIMNTDFCFVVIKGKQQYKKQLSDTDIGRITKILRQQERETDALLEMAQYDPVL